MFITALRFQLWHSYLLQKVHKITERCEHFSNILEIPNLLQLSGKNSKISKKFKSINLHLSQKRFKKEQKFSITFTVNDNFQTFKSFKNFNIFKICFCG